MPWVTKGVPFALLPQEGLWIRIGQASVLNSPAEDRELCKVKSLPVSHRSCSGRKMRFCVEARRPSEVSVVAARKRSPGLFVTARVQARYIKVKYFREQLEYKKHMLLSNNFKDCKHEGFCPGSLHQCSWRYESLAAQLTPCIMFSPSLLGHPMPEASPSLLDFSWCQWVGCRSASSANNEA